MEEVILAGVSDRFLSHYREITNEYCITAVIKTGNDNEEETAGILGCTRISYEDIDESDSRRILIVSQSRCSMIIRDLLDAGTDPKRLIIWTPGLYLKESDFDLTVNGDGSVSARVNTDGKILSAKLKEFSDFFVFEEIFLKNTYRFFIHDDCILFDIGMNIGLASLFFAAKDHIRKVYAFEPFTPSYDRAVANFALNDASVRDKITAFNYGLSSCDTGEYHTYLGNNPGIMRTGSRSVHAKCDDPNAECVQLKEAGKELDRIMKLDPDAEYVIKIDCEGAEYDIIPNLVKWNVLCRIRMIIMETHDAREDELTDLFADRGFAVYSDRPSTHLTGKLVAVRYAGC